MTQALTRLKENFMSNEYQGSLKSLLPEDMTLDAFTSMALTAVNKDPQLLGADQTSLFMACREAAKSGLFPDGKEGALTIFNTKQGDQWVKKVQWMPMVKGVRKLLAKAGWSIRAEVVHQNDSFEYVKGDNPHIHHAPDPFSKERGEKVGVYAIATNRVTGEVFRDAMPWHEVMFIRSCSKSGEKGPWKSFEDEMARKTMIHRLAKQLPLDKESDVGKRVRVSLDAHNDDYDFDHPLAVEVEPHYRDIEEAARAAADQEAPESSPSPEPVIEGESERIEEESPAF